MFKTRRNQFLASVLIFLLGLLAIQSFTVKKVLSATATDLVLSEIQIAGASSGEDFIEIYNPTSSPISLDGYRLVKRTSTATDNDSVVVFASEASVPAHGYYLWCNSGLGTILDCDATTSATVANNNSVAIVNGGLNVGTIVDAVTFGAPTNPLGEGTALTAPEASTSVERKAQSTSTTQSMAIGGTDELFGNGEDTNNNASDFVAKTVSQPQNSEAAIEVLPIASPTPGVSPSPTVEPSTSPDVSPLPSLEPSSTPIPSVTPSATPSISPTPTATPSVTPTPVSSASPSPVVSPSSSPSVTPTPVASPSVIPSATPVVSPSATPVPSVSPTPNPSSEIIFSGRLLTCSLSYRTVVTRFMTFRIPKVSCVRV